MYLEESIISKRNPSFSRISDNFIRDIPRNSGTFWIIVMFGDNIETKVNNQKRNTEHNAAKNNCLKKDLLIKNLNKFIE